MKPSSLKSVGVAKRKHPPKPPHPEAWIVYRDSKGHFSKWRSGKKLSYTVYEPEQYEEALPAGPYARKQLEKRGLSRHAWDDVASKAKKFSGRELTDTYQPYKFTFDKPMNKKELQSLSATRVYFWFTADVPKSFATKSGTFKRGRYQVRATKAMLKKKHPGYRGKAQYDLLPEKYAKGRAKIVMGLPVRWTPTKAKPYMTIEDWHEYLFKKGHWEQNVLHYAKRRRVDIKPLNFVGFTTAEPETR
jgi:hypothetical protein